MHKIIFSLLIINISLFSAAQNVGIGTTSPNASAQLDVSSTNSGFLPPRMTYAQRNAILNPAAGLIVYCIDCALNGEMQYFNGSSWINMSVGFGSAPFTTPVITTNAITNLIIDGAVCGGNITSDGGAIVTERGVCWSTNANPTIDLATKTNDGTGVGMFASRITGLTFNTTYHFRAYATNNVGTSYGGDISFMIPANFAEPVTIGTQVWTTQNLNVSTYSDGTPIPKVEDATTWGSLTTGAYCYYNNDSATYAAVYGKLYNWYAVAGIYDASSLSTPSFRKKLAPAGWHIPTDSEWNKLVKSIDPGADTVCTSCGQSTTAGGAMKRTTGWNNNTLATNSSGFAGLPGSYRGNIGNFYNGIGNYGVWWSTTELNTVRAWDRLLDCCSTIVGKYQGIKTSGFSVRCIRD